MARDDQEAIRLSAANPNRPLTGAESIQISEMERTNGALVFRNRGLEKGECPLFQDLGYSLPQ
jgi:hypothetical protein